MEDAEPSFMLIIVSSHSPLLQMHSLNCPPPSNEYWVHPHLAIGVQPFEPRPPPRNIALVAADWLGGKAVKSVTGGLFTLCAKQPGPGAQVRPIPNPNSGYLILAKS